MNLRKIIKEGINDFDWIENVDESYSVLNKAFYFDPIAESNDKTYKTLTTHFENLGFKSIYGTPDNLQGETAYGLYAYRNRKGKLSYVYTHDDEDDYEAHIRGFAEDESEDGGINLEVVDARDFVSNL